jgi:hypothetical protein
MASITRGKALTHLHARGRGECPLCHRTRIKLIYDHSKEDGKIIRVCKNCRQVKDLKRGKTE